MKKFNDKIVFQDVSLEFELGNYYTITGPNGSGKSTLIGCFLKQHNLDKGYFTFNGSRSTRNEISYNEQVFGINDNIGWIPGLNVKQHLEIILKNHKNINFPSKSNHSDVSSALAELEIEDIQNMFPHSLSSGQEQRVRLASLLLRPARYYFLDEPEKRLDTNGIKWLESWIKENVSAGSMICIATHNESLINIAPSENNIKLYTS